MVRYSCKREVWIKGSWSFVSIGGEGEGGMNQDKRMLGWEESLGLCQNQFPLKYSSALDILKSLVVFHIAFWDVLRKDVTEMQSSKIILTVWFEDKTIRLKQQINCAMNLRFKEKNNYLIAQKPQCIRIRGEEKWEFGTKSSESETILRMWFNIAVNLLSICLVSRIWIVPAITLKLGISQKLKAPKWYAFYCLVPGMETRYPAFHMQCIWTVKRSKIIDL